MEEKVIQLKKIGLSDYEALVYGTLLDNSPVNATYIAKKCNLSRSSVYTTLNTLVGKGLVGTTYKNDVKQFVAQDYSALEDIVKKEKETVEEKFKLLDVLKESFLNSSKSLNIPKIIFFEGQEGLKKIYLSMMRQAPKNSTLYLLRDEFVWDEEWDFIFKKSWKDSVKRIKVEKGIKTKLLVNDSKEEKGRMKLYRDKKNLEVKYLSKKNAVSKFAIYIIGDVVSILSMENNNLVGIKITNIHMAENFRSMFMGLWSK